jgi:uncharacterized protein
MTDNTETWSALTPIHPDYVKVLRITAAIFSLFMICGAAALEFAKLLPAGSFIAPVLLLALWLIIRVPMRRYQARGYDMGDDRIRIVSGHVFYSDVIVPFGRIQHIDVDQGPLQRLYGLATLTVHTAGNHNSTVSLPGLTHDDALTMREAIRLHIRPDDI